MSQPLPVLHLVEDRHLKVSPYGLGNSKLGENIYTYSLLPVNTCPGASEWCLPHCYARRLQESNEWVWRLWEINSKRKLVPEPPPDASVVRFHVSGDFYSSDYIEQWVKIVKSRPEVTFFGFTRSWTQLDLLDSLIKLRNEPNVHLWASLDASMRILPPPAWKRAWIEGDLRIRKISKQRWISEDGRVAVQCLEESKLLPSCESCRFCWSGGKGDLVFLEH